MDRLLLLLLTGTLGAIAAADAEGGAPLDPAALTIATAPVFAARDGVAEPQALMQYLQGINARVQASLVLDAAPAAPPAEPLAGSGWRLWAFWAADVPESAGLAVELQRLHQSGIAIHAVHLASLRDWEAWLFRMNDHREALLARYRRQDRIAGDLALAAFQAEAAPLAEMAAGFHGGQVALVSPTEQAVLLRVRAVPSFRLISPTGRIHSLDGWIRGVDLLAWAAGCRAWEAQQDARSRP